MLLFNKGNIYIIIICTRKQGYHSDGDDDGYHGDDDYDGGGVGDVNSRMSGRSTSMTSTGMSFS